MKLFSAVSAVAALMAAGAQPASPQASVHGAWQIVETWGHSPQEGEWRTQNIQPSLFLFMDGYYSIAYVTGEERRPQMSEDATRSGLSPEQAAAVWIPYVNNTGTYEVTASTITTKPIVAVWPNFMEGGSRSYAYRLEGDTLSLTASGEGWTWNAKLRRLR